MGTKAKPSAWDCYEHAEPDEPMFILLGRDKHAPALVWFWSVLRQLDGEDPVKVAEARQCGLEMIRWLEAHDKKAMPARKAVAVLTARELEVDPQ
jgi:hypothetical protein